MKVKKLYFCSAMTRYPIKILMAFGCTFEPESDEFFEWLMRNGYPELGALSRTIQGDTEAKDWLMQHGFPHLAAIDSAIDKESIAWLEKQELQVFIILADKIRKYLDDKYLNFHKIHF